MANFGIEERGRADARMRGCAAILHGAESSGLEPGSPSHELLEIWTRDRPAPDLLATWNHYIRALCAELSLDQQRNLQHKLLGRARAVAEAAGGFLGLDSKVSVEEEAVLTELERAFAPGS